MNETEKNVLRHHHPELIRDLELRPELLGSFIQLGIFTEDMCEEIKSEHTRRGRVQKLLSVLPKRGPQAFDKFIHAIEDPYPWLAENMRKTHQQMINQYTDAESTALKEKVGHLSIDTTASEEEDTSKEKEIDFSAEKYMMHQKQIMQNNETLEMIEDDVRLLNVKVDGIHNKMDLVAFAILKEEYSTLTGVLLTCKKLTGSIRSRINGFENNRQNLDMQLEKQELRQYSIIRRAEYILGKQKELKYEKARQDQRLLNVKQTLLTVEQKLLTLEKMVKDRSAPTRKSRDHPAMFDRGSQDQQAEMRSVSPMQE